MGTLKKKLSKFNFAWQEGEMDELDREIAEQLRRMIQRAEERDRLAEAYFSPTLVYSLSHAGR